MSKRYTYDEVCQKIAHIGHMLLSKEFKTVRHPLTIQCKCGTIYEKQFESFLRGYYHCNGKISRSAQVKVLSRKCLICGIEFKPHCNRGKYCSLKCVYKNKANNLENKRKSSIPEKECLFCKNIFNPTRNATILCSLDCTKLYQQTDEYKKRAKEWGIKAGKASATSQQKRSKNEIYFAELCEKHFGKDNVLTNEPIFDGWDADVILTSVKTAVLWNGVWHYKQISKSQSLVQVQSRDKLKRDVIERYGYTLYEIKDMGKYKPSFVEMEFECFLFSLMDDVR